MGLRFTKFVSSALAAAFPLLLIGYPGGPPIRRTGAPGDRTCLDASCHVGVRLDDSAGVRLEASGNYRYTPGGAPQRWVLRIDDNLARAYGFQMSVRTAANLAIGSAGHLRAIEPNTQVVCDNQVLSGPGGCTPAGLVQFAQHTEPREHGQFAVEWLPPDDDVGDLVVYVAANASVTGQRNSRIHFRSFLIRPAVSHGVTDAATLRPMISRGSWGTVFGSGLAETTRSWRSDDLRGDELPIALEGVQVRVNGRPAAIHYISPTQVNFQAPDDDVAGEVPVEVWLRERLVASHRVRHAQRAPGIFVLPQNGRDYAAALHSDGCLVGARRPDNSVCARPARAGQVIAIYAAGLGQTDPHLPAGRVVQTAARTSLPVEARIAGQSAPVAFSGLVGPGLYQINVTIPAVPPGEHTIEALMEGQSTQPHVYLTIE